MRFLTILFICLPLYLVQGQSITGQVFDASTQEPLASVNIYYAGTSIGTITDFNGNFSLRSYTNKEVLLVVSLLGYHSQSFSHSEMLNLSNIQLQPKIGSLPAIYLNPDPWSRERKEKYFLRQFIGSTKISKKCKILNLNKVRLQFNPSTNKMIAYAEEPILIENKDLNYLISYDLRDFEISFEKFFFNEPSTSNEIPKPSYRITSSFFIGSAFFKELDEREARRGWVRRHRKRAFKVSKVRLFQLMATHEFEEAGYQLFYKAKKEPFKNHVRSRLLQGNYHIDFRHKEYDILDKKKFQSTIILDPPQLIVAPNGNVISYENLKMGGFISYLKVSGMLPLDYVP